MFNKLFFPKENLINQKWPSICICCLHKTNLPFDLCVYCYQKLPWLKNRCYQCGRCLHEEQEHILCVKCKVKPPVIDRLNALFNYEFPIWEVLSKIKYAKKIVYTRLLGDLLADRIQNHWYLHQKKPEVILPMPLYASRFKQRGFNQALEMAKIIARKINVPVRMDITSRTRSTNYQASMPKDSRQHNVRDAFVVQENNFQHIAIVDDVVTTGHTIESLSMALKATNIAHIDVWCICRGS